MSVRVLVTCGDPVRQDGVDMNMSLGDVTAESESD